VIIVDIRICGQPWLKYVGLLAECYLVTLCANESGGSVNDFLFSVAKYKKAEKTQHHFWPKPKRKRKWLSFFDRKRKLKRKKTA